MVEFINNFHFSLPRVGTRGFFFLAPASFRYHLRCISYIESSRLQLRAPDPATQFPFEPFPLLSAYLVSPNFANFRFTSASVEVTARKEGRKEGGKKRSARDKLRIMREREKGSSIIPGDLISSLSLRRLIWTPLFPDRSIRADLLREKGFDRFFSKIRTRQDRFA